MPSLDFALVNLYENLPFLAAFLAGILTFLSPCILPLIPPYMSYISGISLENLGTKSIKSRIFIMQKAGLFVLGFSLVFIALGVGFNTIFGRFLSHPATNYIAGAIIIIFGVHFLGIFRLNILYKTKRFALLTNLDSNTLIRFIAPLILGIGFALGWSPCVGPILSAIIALNALGFSEGGVALMIIYALGLGVPFLLTAFAIERFFALFGKIKRFYRVIEIISGILLIAIGVAIFSGGLDSFSANFI